VNPASCHWNQNRRRDAVKVGPTVRHSAEDPCWLVKKLQRRLRPLFLFGNINCKVV
jgi:hypothetical protein